MNEQRPPWWIYDPFLQGWFLFFALVAWTYRKTTKLLGTQVHRGREHGDDAP